MSKSISMIAESIDLSKPESVNVALHESLGDNGVKVGSEVSAVDTVTYPYAGQKGKVVSIDEHTGTTKVKFPNGDEVSMQSWMLLPL